jgi:hypothetical protein
MITYFIFFLRYFKYYRQQNLKNVYYFPTFSLIHNILFKLLLLNINIKKIKKNLIRFSKINLLQSILFLQ